jgi:predicted ATPase
MVRLTLQYGVTAHSGFVFSTLGLLTLAAMGDLETSTFFAEMALLMQRTISVKYTKVMTYFVAFVFVFPWTRPLQSCLLPLADVYSSGMQAGNSKYAMWGLLTHQLLMPYQMGKPLGGLLKKCHKQQEQIGMMRVYWQLLLNLTGKAKNETTRLHGEAFTCEDFATITSVTDVFLKKAQTALLQHS